MPYDNQTRTTATKPITPALSSNFRGRPALTPRLAGSAPQSPADGPQRLFRAQTFSPSQDESSGLNGNITPRSGARKSRAGPESPATPIGIRRTQTEIETPGSPQLGLGISSPQRPVTTSGYASTPMLARRTSGGSNISQAKDDTKFFHASELKSVATTADRRAELKSTPVTTPVTTAPKTSPQKSQHEFRQEDDAKFFRVDDITSQLSVKQSRPMLATKFSSSSSVTSRSQVFSTPIQDKAPISSQNPVSPSRSRVRSGSVASSTHTPTVQRRGSFVSLQHPSSEETTTSSLNMSRIAPIVTNGGANISQPQPSYVPYLVGEPPFMSSVGALTSPDTLSPRSTSLTSANTVTTSVTSDTDQSDISKAGQKFEQFKHGRKGSEIQAQISPVSQTHLEAAANARRERKVLDLEISNSSLLAINKTLERELKKQNTELRRFRRLSRSGRLSLAPSNRSTSGHSMATLDTLDELEDEDFDESDLDSEDNIDDEDDGLSDEESSLMSSSDRARRRARDEKRLMLDLSKHQQMLIDSQKLSQSIQRCLNCTDELIKEGTRALAYHVGIGDVKLGGRVLSHDDDQDEIHGSDGESYFPEQSEPRKGLLSPSIMTTALEELSMWPAPLQTLDGQQPSDG